MVGYCQTALILKEFGDFITKMKVCHDSNKSASRLQGCKENQFSV